MTRTISNHVWDAKRNLRGKSASWIRASIGRHVIHILAADEVLSSMKEEAVLTRTTKEALKLYRALAIRPDEID